MGISKLSKVLLTGSNGFLGKYISKYLKLENRLFTLSRDNSDFNTDLKFNVPNFDVKFDFVIHNAGKAHTIPKTAKDKKTFFDVNVNGTNNLLKGLERIGVPKYFVYISSVAVYGIDNGINIAESNPLLAKDPYGLSKIYAERLVMDWCKIYNVKCTILRLPLVVGLNPSGNLKSMIVGLKKGYYFNIAGGKAKKSMVLADDVASIIIRAAEVGGIYNLTDGYHPSFVELSNLLSLQLSLKEPKNLPFWVAQIAAKIGDLLFDKLPINSNKLAKLTTNLIFDDSKAKHAFNWMPRLVLNNFNLNN